MYIFEITGIVQGVGFRPFIYNQAIKHNIKGYVQNTKNGVSIICNNKKIMSKILEKPPSLARIDSIYIKKTKGKFNDFKIIKSEKNNSYSAIPSDLNICDDCVNELFDKNNRRYKYFFISCTNCGPRYSIIKSTPYDREKTSLKNFKLCNKCSKEFNDPTNRRYHAQTIACSECGPKLTLYKNNSEIKCDPISEVIKLIKKNEIIAIKGIGGFHLICNLNSVNKLKKITKRKHKPFALMAKNISMIEKYANVNPIEKKHLESKERSIVLLEKKDKKTLIEISELSSLGFMLPYTPIHYLLLENFDEPLIFTSSNLPSHPITISKNEQFVKYVLDYNRDIVNFVDDSIIKIINKKKLLIRRSRGFAPNEITIPSKYKTSCKNILAVGGELKNTFCIKKKDKLILSQHIGNTYNLENYENFKKTIDKLSKFTQTNLDIILCDKNKEFNTSKYSSKSIEIGHHIAHGFSIALEHNLDNFISIVCDGTGLGNDESIWGGEIFHNDKRIGHLEEQTLIGGDIANKEPVRMLIGILSKFMSNNEIKKIVNNKNINIFIKQKNEKFNCIETTSCGRILDCISILLGFSDNNYYEGRGAMLLESNSSSDIEIFIEPIIINDVLMTTPLFKFIVKNLEKISNEKLASFSQYYLAKGLFKIAKNYSKDLPICFSGGCAYNKIMTNFMIKNKVFLNEKVPSGDGGISFGQIGYWLWKINKF